MDNSKRDAIAKKLKEAGVGHFVDVYSRLSDSYIDVCSMVNPLGINPKHVLGMHLSLICEAIIMIDDPEKIRDYICRAGPLLSNFLCNEMAFVHYTKMLSEEDMEFLDKVERASSAENTYILSMKRILEAVDELYGIRRKTNVATSEHCSRVEKYSEKLCKALRLGVLETEKIRESAALHDIGKIGLPKDIYEARELNVYELEEIKKHPVIGHFILKRGENGYLSDGAGYHHEDWNGHGYPYKKKGEEIPLSARVIRIADSFDAATCRRPWSPEKSTEQVLDEIVKGAGRKYDPSIAKPEIVERMVA